MAGKPATKQAAKKRPRRKPSVKKAGIGTDRGYTIKRSVERFVDPDYPNEARARESFEFTFGESGAHPATTEDLAALRRLHDEQRIPNRLANAREGLALIRDTPEYADGEKLLDEAEREWRIVENANLSVALRNRAGDDARRILDNLVDIIQAGLRRIDVKPILVRDGKRQAGVGKPRKPDVDHWIDERVRHRPGATRDELWDNAPDWITDQIGPDRFKKRVSKARKRAASK